MCTGTPVESTHVFFFRVNRTDLRSPENQSGTDEPDTLARSLGTFCGNTRVTWWVHLILTSPISISVYMWFFGFHLEEKFKSQFGRF